MAQIPSPCLPLIMTTCLIDRKERCVERLLDSVGRLSRLINVIAGIAITFIMFLTVLDVILRFFRRPIVGTYELVAFSGAVVIGFAIPLTSWMRGHIYVDFFTAKLSKTAQCIFNVTTRCMGIGLFFLIGWNLIKVGMDLQQSGEVSLTLQLPFYPVAYGVAVSCFIQCLVLLADMAKIFRGDYE
jgi:TRAP-type C4-dicarboxylate transport system permease small subunit